MILTPLGLGSMLLITQVVPCCSQKLKTCQQPPERADCHLAWSLKRRQMLQGLLCVPAVQWAGVCDSFVLNAQAAHCR